MRLILPAHFTPNRGMPVRETARKHKINGEIKANEVRLVGPDNEMIGVVSRFDALKKAQDLELDLVEIAPQAVPPVCKIIDYGKFAYEIAKKDKDQKKNQTQQLMKEIRFKWRTDTHDFNFKTRHAREFLIAGNKVKGSVMFRGREITHKEIGGVLLEKFVAELLDVAKVDSPIKLEGKNLSVVLAPDKVKKAKETKPKAIPKEKKEAKGTNTEEVVSEESKPLIIEDVTEVTVVE